MSFPVVHTTGHNAAKQSVFLDSHTPFQYKDNVAVLYKTAADGPVDTNNDADLDWFKSTDHFPMPKAGVSCAVINFPPGANTSDFLHRSLSVDVCVVLEGEVESHLDSGEMRLMKRGEVLIQRGTNHYWANPGEVPARMLCFLVPAKPVEGASSNLAGA